MAGDAMNRRDAAHSGRAESTTPSSVNARVLDMDRPVWERQHEESTKAYRTFQEYLHSDNRVVGDHGNSARRWSAEWSWGYRAFEWDLYMSRVDTEAMVGYRRKMNERHRAISRSFQGKVIEWLTSADVSKMRPSEVARWFEVAVRVERAASGADDRFEEPRPDPDEGRGQAQQDESPITFAEVVSGLDLDDADTARLLHEAMRSAMPGRNGNAHLEE